MRPYRQRYHELQEELKAAQAEAAELESSAAELDALEDRYWHDFNDFKSQLRAHVEERDALLCKIDQAVRYITCIGFNRSGFPCNLVMVCISV